MIANAVCWVVKEEVAQKYYLKLRGKFSKTSVRIKILPSNSIYMDELLSDWLLDWVVVET